MELGITKSVEGIKLHLHTDSASESGVITVHKIGTLNNPSDIVTKFMPQASLTKHFSKVGIAEVGIDEVSIHHLRVKLKVNALSSSPTADIDVRSPKSRKKCKDDSVGVSSQETPERAENTHKCCRCDATQFLTQCTFEGCQHMTCTNHREWIARDAISSQWCCHWCMPRAVKCYSHWCMPRAVKCYSCQRNGTQVLLFECEESGCNHRVCGAHSHWSAIDQKVRCHQCAPPGHHGPLIRIGVSSSVDLTSSSSDTDGSGSEEEQRIEEEIRSQDFIGMIGEGFHLVGAEMMASPSDEISQPPNQGGDEPENTGVHVRAHQRTLYDGRVINVRSHVRSKGRGKRMSVSPVKT
eukprot:6490894-Amphidinium_carterae.3